MIKIERLTIKNVNGLYVERTHVTKNQLINRLAEYENTELNPEEIKKLHNMTLVDVGQTVYVVTKYGTCSYEVIECLINRKTVKTRISFSVKGEYHNGNFYNGTFVEKSIGKTVFTDRDKAINYRNRLNKRR